MACLLPLRSTSLAIQVGFLVRIFSTIFLLVWQTYAWSAAVDNGKTWLAGQIITNGTVTGQANSISLPTQVQSEVARTLEAMGGSAPSALLQKIQQTQVPTVEYLARYKLAADQQNASNTTYLTQLISLQNNDGGFGAAGGSSSNALDTAWGLLAMQPDSIQTQAAHNAIDWLLNHQQANGSWLISTDGSSTIVTALVVQALQYYRAISGVSAAQNRARSWLNTKKQTDQSWGSIDSTAEALLALLPAQKNAEAYANTVVHLETTQRKNGSWQDDPYVTAVVLRALWLASQPITNPDLASVKGIVLDNASGQPIAGAQVTLQNKALTLSTDTHGSFSFVGLTPGSDVFSVSASGYRTLTSSLQLQKAQTIDLGNIRLMDASATGSPTVTISGVANYSNGTKIYTASNATIAVGDLNIATNSLGEYTLNNVPPGSFNIVATYSSYPKIRAGVHGQAGQHIQFNPLFSQPTTVKGSLLVSATDSITGAIITQGTVTLNGSNRSINASGEAKFTSGLYAGENIIQVVVAGYEAVFQKINLASDEDHILEFDLTPVTTSNPMILEGFVSDAVSGNPLEAVTVTIEGVTGMVTETDANGFYRLNSPPLFSGSKKVVFEKEGYFGSEQAINFANYTAYRLDTELKLHETSFVGGNSTALILSGVASYINGTRTYPASNATISVGDLTTRTNNQGEYTLSVVPQGTFTLNASFSNYPLLSTNINGQAGQHIRFDPIFTRPIESSVTLLVIATDQDTGAPINGASINLNGTNRNTNTNGEASFIKGVLVGENTVQVNANGYESTLIKLSIPGGQDVTLPVALKPATFINQTVLKGLVTDAATRLPVAGATVSIEGMAAMTVQTDIHGVYQLTSPPSFNGAKKIIIEKTNYYTHEQPITITHNRTHNLDVPLQSILHSGAAASLSVTVGERSTGAALADATITLTGANSETVTTDTNGQVKINNLNVGETQVLISAAGYEGIIATVNVLSGRQYQLPVELTPQVNAAIKLYGRVLDANSQRPLPGVKVTLSGPSSRVSTTNMNGYYEFDQLKPGDWQLAAAHTGFQSFISPITINGSAEANIPLDVDYGTGNPSLLEWGVFATVLDADTLEPLSGAEILLQEVLTGQAVLSESSRSTLSNGTFEFTELTHSNARLFITMQGYDSIVVPLARSSRPFTSLGNLMLKRSYTASLPDLQLGLLDRSGLFVDPYTFTANGVITAEVLNNSNYGAGAFDLILFEDVDFNGEWEPGKDRLIERSRINGLGQQERQTVQLSVNNTQLKFRDAPLYVMVDASREIIESIDNNNTRRVGVSCSGGGGLQDVAICVDASGSVSQALYRIEMEGVIAALENPNIIPHDSSIRFTLDTAYNRKPLHPATVITPATLPQLREDLRAKPPRGGASSGSYCTRYLSEYLLTLPTSTRKTLITIGDGYWESIATAQSMLPQTIANGIARIDAIGVGSNDPSILEANVWPQPANSPSGGRVTIANSAGEVAGAISQAISASIQSVDLTLGNFRMLDQGQGRPVKLAVRVGNAGSTSQISTVEIWQGSTLLGTINVPPLKSGEWTDLELETIQIQGTESLRAIVDPTGLNAECNLANNSQEIPVIASNALASIVVNTDSLTYPAHTPVTLSGLIGNLGGFDANLWVALQIVDENGDQIISYDAINLGEVASGHSVAHVQEWATEKYSAGTYTLHGQVLDQAGNILNANSTIFAITAGATSAAPKGALGISTDKAVYSPESRVRIDSLVRNLTQNAHFNDARVELSVTGPNGSVVFNDTLQLGQLSAGSMRSQGTLQMLRDAPIGEYTVKAVLIGSGSNLKTTLGYAQNIQLAIASTRYQVALSSGAPTSSIHSVPVNQPWAIVLLLLSMLFVAGGTLKRRSAQSHQFRE